MRGIDLLEGHMGYSPGHSPAEMCRKSRIAEGLNEEHRSSDVFVEDGEFLSVIDFPGSVPVN